MKTVRFFSKSKQPDLHSISALEILKYQGITELQMLSRYTGWDLKFSSDVEGGEILRDFIIKKLASFLINQNKEQLFFDLPSGDTMFNVAVRHQLYEDVMNLNRALMFQNCSIETVVMFVVWHFDFNQNVFDTKDEMFAYIEEHCLLAKQGHGLLVNPVFEAYEKLD